MNPYKIWIYESVGPRARVTHNFLIWANCMDDAVRDAKSQLPEGTRFCGSGAQRAD